MDKDSNLFQYDILMDLEVKNTGKTDYKFPIIQEIGYQPCFVVREGDPLTEEGRICIWGVDKLKLTKSEDLSYKGSRKELKSYGYENADEYKDLLALLEGLIVPFNEVFKVQQRSNK